ncbi:BTAD domain-containing putative transcriptional regulator [Nonomuraea sp. NPDC050643]|uniref:AfsR/SARP family transcriptional regulator n=1 Tax=Nonomuraea sp. NPDC050643 TaxID=3155660 RepID=UPI0033DB3348
MTLTSARQRVVLATLLLEANRLVSVDRLIDAVWDDNPPSTARGQIQTCVSRLRRALDDAGLDDMIETRPPGYLFRVGDGALDMHVFERLHAEGRSAAQGERLEEAVETLRRALALWRGTPLADVDSRLVRSAGTRLAESRLSVIEECVEAELRLDRHHEVISELMALVAEHPLRERLRAQLMTALCQAGRPAEALEAYLLARNELVQELGIEPGEELRQLHSEILSGGSPSLHTPARPPAEPLVITQPAAPRLLPSTITDFACREELAAALKDSLYAVDDNAPAMKIVAISGKGGVGKTTLALHVAHAVAEMFPDGQLYAELRGVDATPTSPQRALERFLRALGVPGAVVPSTLGECAEMYRDRLAGRRVLVLLDGAADEEQVRALLPGSASCAVIVTSRARLAGLPGAGQIYLDALDTEQGMQMLEKMTGRERTRAEPSNALTLVRQCGGLPLALRVAAARLTARPHWTVGQLTERLSDEEHRLDELVYAGQGIRANIAVSYESLDPPARRLFRALALPATAEFPGWIAAPLLDCDVDEAAEILESLVDAQLVDVRRIAGGGARYRFHDLIRVFARERITLTDPPEERALALQRVLSTWLFLLDEAHRREYGGDYTIIHGPAPRCPLPPHWVNRELERPLDWMEFERASLLGAIGQAADIGATDICWDLALTMTTLFEARSYFDDWRDTTEVALRTALQGSRLGEAAMLYSGGTLALFQRRLDESAAQLLAARRLFLGLGERHGAALALRNLAFLDRVHGLLDAALAKYSDALTALRDVGDLACQAHVLCGIGRIRLERGQHGDARLCCEQALKIAEVIGSRRTQAQVLELLGEVYLGLGETALADRTFHEVFDIVMETSDPLGQAYALYGIGIAQTLRGDHPAAETSLLNASALARQSDEQLLTARASLALAELYLAMGEAGRAGEPAAEARLLFERLDANPWHARTLDLQDQMSMDEGSA